MKIFRYLKGKICLMSLGFIIKVLGTVMDLIIPLLLAYIIDEVTEVRKIIILGIVMVICAIIAMLFNVIANYIASVTARFFTKSLRHDLFKKINSLSMKQIDGMTSSSVISRMSNDTYNIHQMILFMQRMGVRAPILLIGGICLTFILNKTLTLVLLCSLPVIVIIIILFTSKGLPLYMKLGEKIDNLVKNLRENITGVRVIKALSKKEYEEERFEKVNSDVMNTDLVASKNMAKINPLINLILNIGLVLVIYLGAYLVNDGNIKSGVIISFSTFFTIILNAMVAITRIFMIYSKALASSRRIEEVFSFESDLKVLKELDIKPGSFIEFNNVSFGYNDRKNILKNINFKINKGESLGIIGPTASGKSSIINLLMRFYDCEGSIYIDSKNIKNYELNDLRNMFGVTFQNDSILSDTIKNNIVFGRSYDEERFLKVCDIAHINEFALSKDKGYDTVLTQRGTNISGGQKQRILIARSIYAMPKILILDDSTSALDYETDSLIRSQIKEYLQDVTLIYVSSRVSSIKDFTTIIVLDDGKIVEKGNHNELIKNNYLYKKIYDIQMGGNIDEL